MNKFETQPNEKSIELDKIRTERRKKAYLNTKGEDKEENLENKQENLQKKLDNNQNNDYIEESGDNSNVEDNNEPTEEEKLQKLIEETFGGDPLKLAKSYVSSQSNYTKLRNDYKKAEGLLNNYDTMIENSPTLKNAIENANSVEEIESLITSHKESNDKPKDEKLPSKLDIPTEVTVDDLVKEGYVNEEFLRTLSETEKEAVVRRAELKYMRERLPSIIAQKSVEEATRQIEEQKNAAKQREQKEKNDDINVERYEKGITTIVEKFGLDFAGNEEDALLLDEIQKRAAYIRDPENPDVMDEDAMLIATQKVLTMKGKLNDKVEKRKKETEELVNAQNININKRQQRQSKEPVTMAEKLKARRMKNAEDNINRFLPKRKSEIIKLK
jgi:hypothetical protein